MSMRKRAFAVLSLLAICFSVALAQETNKDVLGALRYRHIGPMGNRLTSIAGIPREPNVYYVGAASGGIWKTTDGGVHWTPIFDSHPVSSIGALAISQSNPNIVWAGTGEPWIRSHISVGQGVYKSTDAGKTWTLMGLEKTGRISRVVIDPKNPDIVLVGALGHAYGPQQERGVFRTTTVARRGNVFSSQTRTGGCAHLEMDANNPNVLFAGMWPIVIRSWGRESGGPGSGLFKSTDGGVTWKRLRGNGLPTRMTGKIVPAIAPRTRNALRVN